MNQNYIEIKEKIEKVNSIIKSMYELSKDDNELALQFFDNLYFYISNRMGGSYVLFSKYKK